LIHDLVDQAIGGCDLGPYLCQLRPQIHQRIPALSDLSPTLALDNPLPPPKNAHCPSPGPKL
jgi:hypothetical protein